jgi:HlyD family secretion protein
MQSLGVRPNSGYNNSTGTNGTPTHSTAPTTTSASSPPSPPSTSDNPAPTTTPAPSTPPTHSPDPSQLAACTAQLQRTLDAENRAADDEKALASAEAALTEALNHDIAAAQPAQPAQPPQPAPGDQTGAGSRGTGSGGRGSSSVSTGSQSGGSATGATPGSASGSGSNSHGSSPAPASADQLAADQAAVDAANADLAVVQQSIAAATLVSPIAGTIANVGITSGQSVSGGSTQQHIVIVGPGSNEVTTSVSDTQVGQVKIGQSATITPDGTSLQLTGKITQIGALGSTTSSGGASYPVTISLDPTSQQLHIGATASVSIALSSTHAAIAVPTSAVRTLGAQHVVNVVRGNSSIATRVTIGVSGATLTQVLSGLQPGDQVALANLSSPLPTSTNTRGLGGFGGGGGQRPGGNGGGGNGGGARQGGGG